MNVKSVLCYGDSNTWGYDPETGGRYPYEKRWTSVLRESLGDGWAVIPEGFNGRTTAFSDPFTPRRNGLKHFPGVAGSHYPVDVLALMIGTNDTKECFNQSVFSITRGLEKIVEAADGFGTGGGSPAVLIIAPPPTRTGHPENEFGAGAAEKSSQLAAAYKALAEKRGLAFFDAAATAEFSLTDGIHLTEESHRRLGRALAPIIAAL